MATSLEISKRGPDQSSTPKTLSFDVKIAKICPADPECQSDEMGSLPFFGTKSVAMATSLEISKKDVQIDHLRPKSFHSM